MFILNNLSSVKIVVNLPHIELTPWNDQYLCVLKIVTLNTLVVKLQSSYHSAAKKLSGTGVAITSI